MANIEVIKVLEISENNYYVSAKTIFSSFACVSNPLLATRFADHITTPPVDVINVFKHAKFVYIKVTWESAESNGILSMPITLASFEQLLDIVNRAKCCLVCSPIADIQEIVENTTEILEEVNEQGELTNKGGEEKNVEGK